MHAYDQPWDNVQPVATRVWPAGRLWWAPPPAPGPSALRSPAILGPLLCRYSSVARCALSRTQRETDQWTGRRERQIIGPDTERDRSLDRTQRDRSLDRTQRETDHWTGRRERQIIGDFSCQWSSSTLVICSNMTGIASVESVKTLSF